MGGAGRMSCRETAAALGAVWLGALVAGGAAALGLGTMLAGAASGVAGMALLRRRNAPPPPRVRLRVVFGGTEHAMEAVVDTGNRALDPVTGLPVIFLPGRHPPRRRAGRLRSIRPRAYACCAVSFPKRCM